MCAMKHERLTRPGSSTAHLRLLNPVNPCYNFYDKLLYYLFSISSSLFINLLIIHLSSQLIVKWDTFQGAFDVYSLNRLRTQRLRFL